MGVVTSHNMDFRIANQPMAQICHGKFISNLRSGKQLKRNDAVSCSLLICDVFFVMGSIWYKNHGMSI